MKVFSKTHSLTIAVGAFAVAPKGADDKPLPKTNLVQAPPGTVLEVDDAEAAGLIREGLVEEFKEDEHKAVDGKVEVPTFQRLTSGEPLRQGMTRPSVVRQDETENDGRGPASGSEGLVVVGDTKDNETRAAQVQKDEALALAARPAPVGAVRPSNVAVDKRA